MSNDNLIAAIQWIKQRNTLKKIWNLTQNENTTDNYRRDGV